MSICSTLPRQTIFVPGPARVISVFICLGVRFCASSRISQRLRKVRPRMKFIERILMREASRSLVAARPQAAAFLVVREHFEVVGERAHPRRHLFLLGAGQEADVLADADRRARHDDFAVALLVHRLRQSRREREQRLAGAGGAEQRDEVDLRIHQRVEREVLLAVARE